MFKGSFSHFLQFDKLREAGDGERYGFMNKGERYGGISMEGTVKSDTNMSEMVCRIPDLSRKLSA